MNQLLKVKGKLMVFFFLVLALQVNGQIATHASLGSLYINGDVDPVRDPLNSFHFGLNKPIRTHLNAEVKVGFGKAVGLSGSYMESAQNGGGLVESAYEGIGDLAWYPNYISNYFYVDLGVNYLVKTGLEPLRFFGGAGIGIANSNTRVNLLNVDGETRYSVKFPLDTPIDEAKESINRLYDGIYETKFEEGGISGHIYLQLGIQFKITKDIYFCVDARHHITHSDYLDSIKYIAPDQESGNNDAVTMLSAGFVGYLLPIQEEKKKLVK